MKIYAFLGVACAVLVDGPAVADAPIPIGSPPSIDSRLDRKFPNAEAVIKSAYVPGLGEGIVPQGLAKFRDGFLLTGYVAGKKPTCRRYWIKANDLTPFEQYDVPVRCIHAGGAAIPPGGDIVIADMQRLLTWKASENSIQPTSLITEVSLSGGLRGASLSVVPGGLMLGSYYKDQRLTTGQVFPWSVLGNKKISKRGIINTVNFPPQYQGVAQVDGGNYWASSQGNPNILSYLDGNGAMKKRFPFLRGLQGVVRGANGAVWTVSESGAFP
jgi:hypothetical protein